MVLAVFNSLNIWIVLMAVLVLLLYLFYKERKMTFHYMPTEENQRILAHLKKVISSYYPSVFIPSNLFKMAISSKTTKNTDHFTRQMIDLHDGEKISLDWLPKNYSALPADCPIVILIPGITSDSRAMYAKIFAHYGVFDYQFRVAIMNRRGYNNMPLHKDDPDPITWNKFGDLDAVIKEINAEFPSANLYLAGLSMGANHIQRYAGMKGMEEEAIPIKGMGCLSSPYCMKTTTHLLNRGNSLVRKSIVSSLKQTFSNQLGNPKFKAALHKRGIDPKVVLSSKTTDDFNASFSLRFTDFKTLDCYKAGVSSVGFVKFIPIPTLAINSLNDMVSPPSAVPFEEINQNPNVIQIMVNSGGHLEYFSGFKLRRWGFDAILTYFKNIEMGLIDVSAEEKFSSDLLQ